MNWFTLAILGHLSNAVAFIVDKTLLNSTFKRSATYAALIGSFSFIALVAIPWVKEWPGAELYPFIIGFGGLFVLALVGFFEALKRAEASRVVPIVGSLIPLFTLLGTALFFQEHLGLLQILGFGLLLIATWILTSGGKGTRLDRATLLIACFSALLFAAASVCGKYAFDHGDFIGVFILSRCAAGVIGLMIGLGLTHSRRELFALIHPKKSSLGNGTRASLLAIVGQLFGAIGFVLVHLSIAHGSAALVNALQAVQYAAIILVAWFGGVRIRKLLHEEINRQLILVKGFAILLVAAGLALLA